MKRTEIKEIFKNVGVAPKSDPKKEITVCGWVRNYRDSKTVAFLELNDGSTLPHMQVVIDKEKFAHAEEFFPSSTALRIVGTLAANDKCPGGVELNAKTVEILGKSSHTEFPIQKGMSLDVLRTMPHLRPRTNTFNAMFRVRSVLSYAIHKFYNERGYIMAHAPIITGGDAEGAGEMFKLTTIGFSTKFKSEEEYNKADFFGREAGLTVSGQMEAEVLAMSHGKVYTFGPTFRAEPSQTTKHAAEFWMVEPEIAFATLPDVIELAQDFVKYITKYTLENASEEIDFFTKHFDATLRGRLEELVKAPFKTIEYKDALEVLIKSGRKFEQKVEWGLDLATEHERYLAEVWAKGPVFVTHYPREIKAFYMKQSEDGKTVACTDLLIPGIGELIGGSQREEDYDKLITEIKRRKMKMTDYEHYLALRKFGTCPHGGFGLGFERMLMYVTGIGNIRDTILYPRAKGELR
ncbi:MAG: asparagine--tRNA ligase [Firmicutes bacterium]|nr:asparagine--tRNA ligase [Bacillota bacterium]